MAERSKVWLLYSGDMDDEWELVGAYLTEELAKQAQNAFGGWQKVIGLVVDEYREELEAGKSFWRIQVLSTGEEQYCKTVPPTEHRHTGYTTWTTDRPHQPRTYHLQGILWAKTRDEALAEVEKVRKYQVSQGWGKGNE